jgi:hypothetical protein
MTVRNAVLIAACVFPFAAGPAAAQFQQAPPAQEMPPCVKEFISLREDAQKRAQAIQAASQKKVPPREACQLFTAFSAAEDKMIKYAAENSVWCGIPPNVLENLKQAHVRTVGLRTQVCRAAAAPPRPAGPSLSDALTAPVTDSSNIKTGRGTFDTLTGTPLGSK